MIYWCKVLCKVALKQRCLHPACVLQLIARLQKSEIDSAELKTQLMHATKEIDELKVSAASRSLHV